MPQPCFFHYYRLTPNQQWLDISWKLRFDAFDLGVCFWFLPILSKHPNNQQANSDLVNVGLHFVLCMYEAIYQFISRMSCLNATNMTAQQVIDSQSSVKCLICSSCFPTFRFFTIHWEGNSLKKQSNIFGETKEIRWWY